MPNSKKSTKADKDFFLGENVNITCKAFKAAREVAKMLSLQHFTTGSSQKISQEPLDCGEAIDLSKTEDMEKAFYEYSRDIIPLLNKKNAVDLDFVRRCFSEELISVDPFMIEKTMREVQYCCYNTSPVLITGDTGTGKEVVAKTIHNLGSRRDKPFIAINCGGIPTELLESELFGHKKGAFTGAHTNKKGLMQQANGGTLFLDEIGEMPPLLQAKLLRVLNDKRIVPIGVTNWEKDAEEVDIRLIAATNKDLGVALSEEEFRRDLYYRLNSMEINLIPLYMRPGDLPLLIYYFIQKNNAENKDQTKNAENTIKIKKVSSYFLFQAIMHEWKGNIRELRNLIERACNISRVKRHSILTKLEITGCPTMIFDQKEIRIEELPGFNLIELMEEANNKMMPEFQETWKFPYRVWNQNKQELDHREEDERGIEIPVSQNAEDPYKAIRELTFGELKKEYAKQLLDRHGNKKAAAKAAGVDWKTINKWSK